MAQCAVLSLPDELLENVLLQALQDSLGNVSFATPDSKHSTAELHRISVTCQRFRWIILPMIYCNVNICSYELKRTQCFLAMTPTYGYLCRRLVVDLGGTNVAEFSGMLCDHFQYFSMLQVLGLYANVLRVADAIDREPWKRLCSALPNVPELEIYADTNIWEDTITSLRDACSLMSCVRKLGILFPVKRLPLETAEIFHDTFTGIVDVRLDCDWPYTPEWIRSAFTGRQLTRLSLYDPYPGHAFPLTLRHDWSQSISLLIQLNMSSLTSLEISSGHCIMLPFEEMTRNLPHLNTLAIHRFNFGRLDKFEAIMRPFVKCPLQSLDITRCHGIPATFHTWFDPVLKLWPYLKSLKIHISASPGPGDPAWDEMGLERRQALIRQPDGFDTWNSHTRLTLRSYCFDRGINYVPLISFSRFFE